MVTLAIGSGAVGGSTPTCHAPTCKSRPPAPSQPPFWFEPALPRLAAITSRGVSPIARPSPISRIIGAIKSPSYPAPGRAVRGASVWRSSAVATATTPSCHVERKPLPPNLEPSGVSTPSVKIDFNSSSSILVRVIMVCHSRRCSMVTDM